MLLLEGFDPPQLMSYRQLLACSAPKPGWQTALTNYQVDCVSSIALVIHTQLNGVHIGAAGPSASIEADGCNAR